MGHSKSKSQTKTASYINLNDYAGQWYEIARLPNPYQSPHAKNIIANYIPKSDGSMMIINSEYVGTTKEVVTGHAHPIDKTNSKFKVHMAIPNSKPFCYWILEAKRLRSRDDVSEITSADLDDCGRQYFYAFVSNPEKTCVWILARVPRIDYCFYNYLLKQLKERHGVDISRIITTCQNWG